MLRLTWLSSFNVAALDRARNRGSMNSDDLGAIQLQCGRARSSAESCSPLELDLLVCASMWPRSIERGIGLPVVEDALAGLASMWPRSIERGISRDPDSADVPDDRLQCG